MTGTRIRELRMAAHMTQYELSKRLEVSPSAIGMYEQGRRQPDPELILKLCGLFDTTADWLLFGRDGVKADPVVTTDVAALLAQWRRDLAAQTGQLFYTTPEGRRFLMTPEETASLWQAVEVATEVTLRGLGNK